MAQCIFFLCKVGIKTQFSKHTTPEKPSTRPEESLYPLEADGHTAALEIQPAPHSYETFVSGCRCHLQGCHRTQKAAPDGTVPRETHRLHGMYRPCGHCSAANLHYSEPRSGRRGQCALGSEGSTCVAAWQRTNAEVSKVHARPSRPLAKGFGLRVAAKLFNQSGWLGRHVASARIANPLSTTISTNRTTSQKYFSVRTLQASICCQNGLHVAFTHFRQELH